MQRGRSPWLRCAVPRQLHQSSPGIAPQALDPDDFKDVKSSGFDLVVQLFGSVEMTGREPQARARCAVDDQRSPVIRHPYRGRLGQRHTSERDISRKRRSDKHAAWLEHTGSLGERQSAICGTRQVIERSEQKRGIKGLAGEVKVTGVTQVRGEPDGARRIHVASHRIDQLHVVTMIPESLRVNAGPSADINYATEWRVLKDQLLRALKLEWPLC